MEAGALPPTFGAVLEAVAPLAARFSEAGHRLYLVGGVVRDRFLGLPLGEGDDIDCTTDASPDQIRRLVAPIAEAVWLQGVAFGTVGCMIGGRPFEITTHRAESYRAASRKPTVSYSDDVVADLSRRDFTVNAMAVAIPEGTLVDPFGGRDDLTAKLLRTPLEPAVSFGDDPLRMLRAARFVAGLDLDPVPELEEAVCRSAHRLAIVSAERVRDELDRLLDLPRPSEGLRFLRRTGLLSEVLPELADDPDDAFHGRLRAVDAIPAGAEARHRSLARFVVLAGRIEPSPPADPSAAEEGAAAVARRARALRWSRRDEHTAAALARAVVAALGRREPWDAAAVRRLLDSTRCDPELLLSTAAAVAQGAGDPALGERQGDLALHVRRVVQEEGRDFEVPLDGEEVMALLSVPPGPVVGEALAELRRLRLERGPLGREEAVEHLLGWWRERG